MTKGLCLPRSRSDRMYDAGRDFSSDVSQRGSSLTIPSMPWNDDTIRHFRCHLRPYRVFGSHSRPLFAGILDLQRQ